MKDNKSVSNRTQPTTLLLPSCTYIDLTAVQAMCGPGYKAEIEKQETDLLLSIFFDNTSGNIVYAVHRQERYLIIRSVLIFKMHYLQMAMLQSQQEPHNAGSLYFGVKMLIRRTEIL